jgi:hypothetical protein
MKDVIIVLTTANKYLNFYCILNKITIQQTFYSDQLFIKLHSQHIKAERI